MSLILIMFVAVGLTACGSNDDNVEVQKEYFESWILGRNQIFAYTGDYTTTTTSYIYKADKSIENKDIITESRSGNKFYRINTNYEYNDSSVGEMKFNKIQAIKTVQDGEVERTKYYVEVDNRRMDFHTKEGTYVRPDYVTENAYHSPQEEMEECYINLGDTYEDFIASVNNLAKDDMGEEFDKIKFVKNKDDSITLKLSKSGSYLEEDEEYNKVIYSFVYGFTVKDGKMVQADMEWNDKYIYDDASKNVDRHSQRTITFQYEFNQTEYDSISVETDTTSNQYKGTYYFVFEGYRYMYDDDNLVGEIYTSEMALDFLESCTYLVIHSEESIRNYYGLYTDAEMTQPFTSETTEYASKNIYVKFNLPEDKAMVLCVFKNEQRERLDICYVVTVGNTFRPNYRFPTGTVIEIDGEEPTEGESTDFVCGESRVYVVKFWGN